MFKNLRTRFAVQRTIDFCEKQAKNNITGSMAIIAAYLHAEAKNSFEPDAKPMLEKLFNKHTEIVRKYALIEDMQNITAEKAQFDSVVVCAINENELKYEDLQGLTVEDVVKICVNLNLMPARFLDLQEQL